MRTKQIITAAFLMTGVVAMSFAGAAGKPAGGTVSGKVTYEGTPAKQKPIDMSKEPSCAKQYATPPTTETVVTGAGNALDNVVVYISAGAPDESAPSQAVTFDQKGCRYHPARAGVPDQSGIEDSSMTTRPRTTFTRWPKLITSGTSRSRRELRRCRKNSKRRNSFP